MSLARKMRIDPANDVIHSNLWPMDIRNNSFIEATVSINGTPFAQTDVKLWRISPMGAEFWVGPTVQEPFKNKIVDIAIQFADQTVSFHGIRVHDYTEGPTERFMAVRWCEEPANTVVPIADRRRSQRWTCSEMFLPTGVANNPCEFNDLILFRVVDISREGLRLVTSLRNKIIIPGVVLDTMLTFPSIGSSQARIRIQWVRITTFLGKDVLSFGATLENPSADFLEAAGQYVLQFGPAATAKDIFSQGLKVKSVTKATTFSYVRTEKDYEDVIELRRLTYKSYFPDGATSEQYLRDVYDSRSRILIARHQGKCIGSLRLTFHGTGEKIEQAECVTLPNDFPRNDELLEVTRICIHPDYRKSDLLVDMIKQCLLVMIQTNRPWLVGSTPEELKKTYRGMGAIITDMGYVKKLGDSDLKLTVIQLNVFDFLRGKGVNPIVWNLICSDVIRFATERRIFKVDAVTAIRLRIYRFFSPLARLFKKS